MRRFAIAVVAALALVAPARAQTATVQIAPNPPPASMRDAEFTVSPTVFRVPVPPGYCIDGKGVATYLEQQRAKGPQNVPDLVMMACDEKDQARVGMFVVIVRRQTGANNQRASLLASMAKTLPVTPGEPDLAGEAGATMVERLGARLVRRVGAGAEVGALGVDEMCAYVGGSVVGPGGVEGAGAGCMTVIGGHIVLVSRYRSGRAPDEVAATIPEVKAMALSISTRALQ